jgi:hypothetical protein
LRESLSSKLRSADIHDALAAAVTRRLVSAQSLSYSTGDRAANTALDEELVEVAQWEAYNMHQTARLIQQQRQQQRRRWQDSVLQRWVPWLP